MKYLLYGFVLLLGLSAGFFMGDLNISSAANTEISADFEVLPVQYQATAAPQQAQAGHIGGAGCGI